MRLIPLVGSFLLISVVGGAAFAKQMPLACSVHPKRGASAASLAALATVRQAEAEKTAIESLSTSSPATVTEGELEVEHGCLVYSFDIRVTSKDGVEEVLIDAGSGKVLFHEHENSRQEQAEQAKEKKANQQH